jgi:hypothetical protein
MGSKYLRLASALSLNPVSVARAQGSNGLEREIHPSGDRRRTGESS